MIRNITYNFLSTFLNFIITVLIGILVNPIILEYIGNYKFGIWKSLQKLYTVTAFSDGRISQLLKLYISKSKSENQKKLYLKSSVRVLLRILPITLIIVAILNIFILDILNINQFIYEAKILSLILGFIVLITPFINLPISIISGENVEYKFSFLGILITAISFILTLTFLELRFDIYSMVLSLLISKCLALFLGLNLANKFKWVSIKIYKLKNKVYDKIILKNTIWFSIWSIVSKFLLGAQVLIVSFFFGPDKVTNFTITFFAYTYLNTISFLLINSIIPSLGKKLDFERKKSKFIDFSREIYLTISIIAVISTLFLNQYFVSIWVGEDYYLGFELNLLFAVQTFIFMIFNFENKIFDYQFKLRTKSLIGIITLFSCISTSILVTSIRTSISSILIPIMLGQFILFVIFFLKNQDLGIRSHLLKLFKISLNFIIIYIASIFSEINFKNVLFILIVIVLTPIINIRNYNFKHLLSIFKNT